MKTCSKCGEEKPLREFHRHKGHSDGHHDICKECRKIESLKRYSVHKEHIKAQVRRYYEANQEKAIMCSRKWHQENPAKHNEYAMNHRKKYPLKIKSRRELNNAIKAGHIERRPCENCGEIKSEAHHEDYTKPLEVIWLCDSCHKALHKKLRSLTYNQK